MGEQDFEAIRKENYFYVDKTLLIRDFLDERAKVSLFTRPRRFGKTLNMDMLRVFLKRRTGTQRSISGIKRFGSAGRHTGIIRANTP